MFLDQGSLLMAVCFSGAALSTTLFVAWLGARNDGFLLTWSAGVSLVVCGVAAFSIYTRTESQLMAVVAYSLFIWGLSIIYGAAYGFRRSQPFLNRTLSLALVASVAICLPFAAGLDGLGTLLLNLISALILLATAYEYWGARRELPLPVAGLMVLYSATGLSFIPCAITIAIESPFVLSGPPGGLVENINAIVGIISMTGIGAISLALNQTRLARIHRADALTDSLTGLINRRALFDRYGSHGMPAGMSVILLDLDQFKSINDQYGHDAGDRVLQAFSRVILRNVRRNDVAARLGGEEFAVVLPRSTPDLAVLIADSIRTDLEQEVIETEFGPLRCTVSAGLASAQEPGIAFDAMLKQADSALYYAKRNGRNRVSPFAGRRVA